MAKEIALPALPVDTEIVKQARQIAVEDADDLAVLQFLMQAQSAAQLTKMRKLEESKVPTGLKPLKLTIGDTITKIQLDPPWISFSLLNDGTGSITGWVNDEQDPLQSGMVLSGETWNVDMEYPVIKSLFLKAASGTTASVRIYGKEGRR